jgi:hypothetical protein
MLKPRRKIIKKELKKDPYIEFLAKSKNNVDKNRTLYMRWALGVVAVIVAVAPAIVLKRSESLTALVISSL